MTSRDSSGDVVVNKVRKSLLARIGSGGLKEIVSQFRALDTNRNGQLDAKEFEVGLQKMGVKVTAFEARYLVMAFDSNNNGGVSLDEFVRALRGNLNKRRLDVVVRAFAKFDRDGSGSITIDDLTGLYKADQHPEVLQGRRTQAQVLHDFLKCFDSERTPDGVVTRDEFECYYAGVSANIDSDDYFEAMVIRTWDLDDPKQPRLATTEREGGNVAPQPPFLPQELYLTNNKKMNSRQYDTSHMHLTKSAAAPKENIKPKELKQNYTSTYNSDYTNYGGGQLAMSRAVSNVPDEPIFSPTGHPVLDRVRKKVIERAGKDAFLGMARTFRVVDRNRSGYLDVQEFKEAMTRYKVPLSAVELDTIMKSFDTNGDGNISLTEFLRGVRGPMVSAQRIDIVKKAFSRLEKDGDGRVTLKDIAQAYDVDKHPDVVSAKRSREEVLREFIKGWDRNGDDEITLDEFMEYYSSLSAGIDSNQYFELMVRNAWHISGGTGVTANTSNRRVLVTYKDGRQTVEEIKNDFKDDIPTMIENLKAQGIQNIESISLAN